MFRCHFCGGVSAPSASAHRVVVEQRPRVYAPRYKANYLRGLDEHRDDPGGEGWEIVREVLACGGCAHAIRERQIPVPVAV